MGTLKVDGSLRVSNKIHLGDNLRLNSSNEGGNIRFISPTTNTNIFEFDNYDGKVLRLYYSEDSGNNVDKSWIFRPDGSLSSTLFKGPLDGNASTASKWQTTRTLSLTNTITGSASIDGSGNILLSTNIRFVNIDPDTFASNFRSMIKGDSSSGQFLSTIRCESNLSGYLNNYSAGLAWGTHDTHAYIDVHYAYPIVYIGGGNNNGLNWTRQIAFTDSTVAGANYASSAGNADTLDGYHASAFLPLNGGTMTGLLNVGGKVELWTDGESGNIRITSPDGSRWSIDALNNTQLRFIWAEQSVPVTFSSGGGIFGNSMELTSHTWTSGPTIYQAPINFKATIDALTSTTYYKPWFGGSHGISGQGYYATITAGLYHTNDPSRGGFYIGASWDMNASDTFYYFARDGHFITPRLVTNNYGSSFPGTAYTGEVFFKI